DIDRQLVRLGTRQQHAVAKRMQETVLADPFLLVDDDPIHDCDLTGRTAKAERGNAQPDKEGFSQRNAVVWRRRGPGRGRERSVGQGSCAPGTGGDAVLIDWERLKCRPSMHARSPHLRDWRRAWTKSVWRGVCRSP